MKRLFTNDRIFLAMVICAVVGQFAAFAQCIIPSTQNYQIGITFILMALCEVTLFISYKKHEKNIMKGIIGVLLAVLFLKALDWIGADNAVDKIFGTIDIICLAALGVNHFVINANHHSKPTNIVINQLLCILYFVCLLIWDIIYCAQYFSLFYLIATIIELFSMMGVSASIVCVESRLDAYRLDREKAGWTEEKGYPENYVHQYEKK